MHPCCDDVGSLFYHLIGELVDHPEDLRIRMVPGGQSTLLEVYAREVEIRQIIGGNGRLADSLREILVNIGARRGVRYILDIVESDIATPADVIPSPWDTALAKVGALTPPQRIAGLLAQVLIPMVEDVEAIDVRTVLGSQTIIFNIHVSQRDLPRVLGRDGRTTIALRTLVGAMGGRHRFRSILDVNGER